ncbi:hypothetical protein RhiirB3_532863 [Rhizophagus irregularis]|nr:hypothetical protein RhiirB3_532863 [Rhizophagus irregularis]
MFFFLNKSLFKYLIIKLTSSNCTQSMIILIHTSHRNRRSINMKNVQTIFFGLKSKLYGNFGR